MKALLFITLCLLCLSGFGQNGNGLPEIKRVGTPGDVYYPPKIVVDTNIWQRRDTIIHPVLYIDTIGYSKPDTTKAMLLVCNTAHYKDYGFLDYQTMKWHEYTRQIYGVTWQYGYVVSQIYKPLQYLDERKKKLSPNVVVWQFKPINTNN